MGLIPCLDDQAYDRGQERAAPDADAHPRPVKLPHVTPATATPLDLLNAFREARISEVDDSVKDTRGAFAESDACNDAGLPPAQAEPSCQMVQIAAMQPEFPGGSRPIAGVPLDGGQDLSPPVCLDTIREGQGRRIPLRPGRRGGGCFTAGGWAQVQMLYADDHRPGSRRHPPRRS